MKKLIPIIFLFPISIAAQSFTINGIKSDTIYVGAENNIVFHDMNCHTLKYEITPKVNSKYENCVLTVHPTSPNKDYHFTIRDDVNSPLLFTLHSQSLTLDIKCLANTLLPTETKTLKLDVAKQLRGVKPIVNCPWMRDVCSIMAYTFRIEKNREIVYIEEIRGWSLSVEAKSALGKITRGTKIIFESIRHKCPVDCSSSQSDIELDIE